MLQEEIITAQATTLILTPNDCKQLLKAVTQVRMAEPGQGPEEQAAFSFECTGKWCTAIGMLCEQSVKILSVAVHGDACL